MLSCYNSLEKQQKGWEQYGLRSLAVGQGGAVLQPEQTYDCGGCVRNRIPERALVVGHYGAALPTLSYVAAAHDIGKAYPSFQKYNTKGLPISNFRHEQYGAEILKALGRKRGWSERQTGLLRAVVRLHHRGKGMCDTSRRIPEEYRAYQASLEDRMWQLFTPASKEPLINSVARLAVPFPPGQLAKTSIIRQVTFVFYKLT